MGCVFECNPDPTSKTLCAQSQKHLFFWCNFHHTSDPSFLALTKKSLAVAPRFFLQKFKLKLTKTNAYQSLNEGFESHMRKLTSVDLIPHFLHIFSIPLLSKKQQNAYGNIYGKQKFAKMKQVFENVSLLENSKMDAQV